MANSSGRYDDNSSYADVDVNLFSAHFECLHKYQRARSLRGARHYLAMRIAKHLPPDAVGSLQVFLRHPLGSDICPVTTFVLHHDGPKPIPSPSSNLGLHPLCKVLDLLVPSRDFLDGFALRVDLINNNKAPHPYCGFVEIMPNESRVGFPMYAPGPSTVSYYKHMALFTQSMCSSNLDVGVLDRERLLTLTELTVYPALFADRALLHETLCGSESLSRGLNMPLSMFTYKLIAGGLAEAVATSSSDSEMETMLTVVIPTGDPYGFGVSASFIGQAVDCIHVLSTMTEVLKAESLIFNKYLSRNSPIFEDHESARRSVILNSTPEDGIRSVRSFAHQPGRDNQTVPPAIGLQIKSYIRHAAKVPSADSLFLQEATREQNGRQVDLSGTFQAFLSLCTAFCDEEHENLAQEFGLLLTNPSFLEACPGPRLIPLCDAASAGDGGQVYEWSMLDSIRRRIELVSDPRDRCIVFPYSEYLSREPVTTLPAFVCDLRVFREMVMSMPEVALWSSMQALYVGLTIMFPWTVGVTAGPGAQLKVYAAGDMVAFRDGKGWRIWHAPVTDRQRNGGSSSASAQRCMSEVLRISKQFSKYVRPGRHGALIVYEPDEQKVLEWQRAGLMKPLRPIRTPTLSGKGWEENRSLFIHNGRAGESTLNHETVRFLYRAAALDGAICLTGSDAHICGVAQHLSFAASSGRESVGGTKRLAALSFSQQCSPDGFAIAVSTDGPVRLFSPSINASDGVNCFPLAE